MSVVFTVALAFPPVQCENIINTEHCWWMEIASYSVCLSLFFIVFVSFVEIEILTECVHKYCSVRKEHTIHFEIAYGKIFLCYVSFLFFFLSIFIHKNWILKYNEDCPVFWTFSFWSYFWLYFQVCGCWKSLDSKSIKIEEFMIRISENYILYLYKW